jgi:hypothetical protein
MLWRKKIKRPNNIPAFNFEMLPPPEAPSVLRDVIASYQLSFNVLTGALIVGLILNIVFAHSVQSHAAINPFVVDGGVFGCPVPILEIQDKP